MFWPIKKIVRKLMRYEGNEHFIKAKTKFVVEQINPLEDQVRELADKELLNKSQVLQCRLANGENRESVLAEAFAIVREATHRVLDCCHTDMQLLASIILDRGEVAEIPVGEDTIIVSYPAIFMGALERKRVHIVTGSDVLAKQAADFARPVFELLGLAVGYVTNDMEDTKRLLNYGCDVTYGSYETFGMQCLRDNRVSSVWKQYHGPLDFAIIDEVDSILIDKVRDSLQLVAPGHYEDKHYSETQTSELDVLAQITVHSYFRLYKKLAGVTFTARTDKKDFSEIYGLNVVAIPSVQPVNRIDYDDCLYINTADKYYGIAEEIRQIRSLGRPVLVGAMSKKEAWEFSQVLVQFGIAHEILSGHFDEDWQKGTRISATGRHDPLGFAGLHDARQTGFGQRYLVRDVTIVTDPTAIGWRAEASRFGRVLCDTCKVPPVAKVRELGIEPDEVLAPGSTKCCLNCQQYDKNTACGHCFKPKLDPSFPMRGRTECRMQVPCGLHIIGIGRHTLRRLDNKLLSRFSGQGEPGSSRFFLSFEDELLKAFTGQGTVKAISWIGGEDHRPIYNKRINKSIARSQTKMQKANLLQIKGCIRYDNVLDQQMWRLYAERQNVLQTQDMEKLVVEIIHQCVRHILDGCLDATYTFDSISKWVSDTLGIDMDASELTGNAAKVKSKLVGKILYAYERHEVEYPVKCVLNMIPAAAAECEQSQLSIVEWANHRLDMNLTINQLQNLGQDDLYKQLCAEYEKWLHGSSLADAITTRLGSRPDIRAAIEYAEKHFNTKLQLANVEVDVLKKLVQVGHHFLRQEMTDLERSVLLTVYDEAWKNHLQHMKQFADDVFNAHFVGETTEQSIKTAHFETMDPKLQYKTYVEKAENLFEDTLGEVPEKIIGLLFTNLRQAIEPLNE